MTLDYAQPELKHQLSKLGAMAAPARIAFFKAIAASRSSGAGASQSALDAGASGLPDAGEQRRGCGLGKFFALAARTQERAEDLPGEQPDTLTQRKALTAKLIQNQAAQFTINQPQPNQRKKRYNNARRASQKKARAARKDFKASRGCSARVSGLVSRTRCFCARQCCFSQFQAIMDELVQLLSLFASQRKAVRDTVLEQCVGESVCVLGLFLSLACFRRLFQLGKMRLARFFVDLRMKGRPRLARVACQEAKVRAYLVTLYTSTLDAVACRALLVKTNLCTSRKPKL